MASLADADFREVGLESAAHALMKKSAEGILAHARQSRRRAALTSVMAGTVAEGSSGSRADTSALVASNTLGSGGAAGVNWDNFTLGFSAMTLDGTLEISLDGISFSNDAYWQADHVYTLVDGGFVDGAFTSIANGTYTNGYGTGMFTQSGNEILYSFVAVPEPQTWALAALGVPPCSSDCAAGS